MQGTLNTVVCPNCHSSSRSLDPFLYHDMTKNLMFYVAEGGDPAALRETVESSQKDQALEGLPQPAIYVLDDTQSLIALLDQLEGIQCEDGTSVDDLDPEEWRDIVDAIVTPMNPWPLDHRCVCGEEIRTLCFCTTEGVWIDVREHELNLQVDSGFECPQCGRGLMAFHCEKCNRLYSWQEGVVDRVADQ